MARGSKNWRDRPLRPNATGRSDKSSRFIGIPHRVYLSEAVCSLNPNARAMLFELAMMENGKNNGSIYLSVRDASDRLGFSDYEPAQRAFGDLMDRGLIAMTKEAHFSIKAAETSRARCWRLTWLPWPEGPRGQKAPTNEWESYQAPGKTPARKRANRRLEALARYRKAWATDKIPVRDSRTIEAEILPLACEAVRETPTDVLQIDANPPISNVRDSPTHTAVTMGYGGSMWWINERFAIMAVHILLLRAAGHFLPSTAAA